MIEAISFVEFNGARNGTAMHCVKCFAGEPEADRGDRREVREDQEENFERYGTEVGKLFNLVFDHG